VTSSARRVNAIKPIDVRLISAKAPEICPTSWEHTLEKLFETSDISSLEPHNAKSMYSLLMDTVIHMQHDIKTWKCPKVLRMFLTGELCASNVHCEAILASLLKYSDNACQPSEDMKVAIEVRCYILLHCYNSCYCIEVRSEVDRYIEIMLPCLLGAPRCPQGS
jgi:hypothetical protein